jgi:cell division septation protein DedD
VILASLPANPPSDSACTVAQVVQLGAFLDAPRARAAAAQARAYGPVQLEPVLVAGQAALRVRAGPFPAGPPTDHVLGRLRASGYRDAFIVGQSQSSPIAC